jgi:carbon storage regulator
VLVLTRRAGESLMVGDDVVITVLDVRGDVVRIGIKAPRSVQVHREEVYRELQRVNREAASPSDLAVAALGRMFDETPAPTPAPAQAQAPIQAQDAIPAIPRVIQKPRPLLGPDGASRQRPRPENPG